MPMSLAQRLPICVQLLFETKTLFERQAVQIESPLECGRRGKKQLWLRCQQQLGNNTITTVLGGVFHRLYIVWNFLDWIFHRSKSNRRQIQPSILAASEEPSNQG